MLQLWRWRWLYTQLDQALGNSACASKCHCWSRSAYCLVCCTASCGRYTLNGGRGSVGVRECERAGRSVGAVVAGRRRGCDDEKVDGVGCEVRHFPTSALLTTNRQLESRRDGRCEHCYSLHAHTYSCLGIREIKVVALFNAPKKREKEGERERERERKKGVKGEGGRQPMKAANNRAVGQEVLGESESDMSE